MTEIFSKCLRNFSSNPRNVKVQSDFLKYLTPLHCVLPFLPFPSQQPGLSALNRKKPGKGRPQKKEGHGWLLLGQRKNGFAVLTFCIAVTTGTMHIDAFGPDLVQSRNKISFCISLCIYFSSQNKDNQRLLVMAFYSHSKVAFFICILPTLTSLIKGHARLFFSRKKSSLPSDFHVIDWKFHPTR